MAVERHRAPPLQAPGVSTAAPSPRTITITRPRLRADLDPILDRDQRFVFVGEQRLFFLEGPVVQALVPLLDGTRNVIQLCQALSATASPSGVLQELSRLEQLGALVSGPRNAPRAVAAFLEGIGSSADHRAAVVLGLGTAPAAELAQTLTAGGLDVEVVAVDDELPQSGIVVVVVTDHLHPQLTQINQRMLAAGRPWIICKPTSTLPWIGPLFVPGRTACWSCLAYRVVGHRQLDAYFRLTSGRSEPVGVSSAATGASIRAVGGLLAAQLPRASEKPDDSALLARIVSLNLVSMELERHVVVRRPQCPECGDPAATAGPRRIEVGSRPTLPWDGMSARSHRVRARADTLAALEEHISPVTGIVTSVSPVDTGTELFSGYAAGHSFAISRTRFDVLARTLRGSLSGGKGRSPEQAEVGAICEAVERGSSVYRGDEMHLNACYDDVRDEAVDPEVLLGFSEEQYDHATERNAASESRFEFIPRRLDPALPIDWTQAWSPVTERHVLVPSAYTYYGHPDMYQHWFCVADSNGSASGNCVEEAIASGFYELIERDSVALWWYNRVRRPAVDLEALQDPYLDDVREYHAAQGREIWGLDLTTDSGVAAYAMVSRRHDHPVEDLIVGFGAHLDPRAAIDGAIDELNQFMPSVATRRPDGSTAYWSADSEALRWYRRATIATDPYFLPDPSLPATRIADVIDRSSDDVGKDVEECVRRAEAMGLELFTVDLSRPEVDLAVVRVIVPGLRHFWRRLGPGRLYDTPVALGWLPRALTEAELNPETVYF